MYTEKLRTDYTLEDISRIILRESYDEITTHNLSYLDKETTSEESNGITHPFQKIATGFYENLSACIEEE